MLRTLGTQRRALEPAQGFLGSLAGRGNMSPQTRSSVRRGGWGNCYREKGSLGRLIGDRAWPLERD